MDTTYLVVVVFACLVGSWCAWLAYAKWHARGLWGSLGLIALSVGTWGVVDWMAQEPRESPLYAYALLALAPPVLVGAFYTAASRRSVPAALAILGSAILASAVALSVPFIAYVFP